MWHHYDGSQHNVLTMNNITEGTIIDVHAVFTLANNLSALSLSIATGSLGAIGWPYLDTSAGKLEPVGKPAIGP